MVKKFRRAAAGLEEQLPSDLRPPAILKRTCDYLFDDVIGNAPSLAHVHHFVWDRTRAIRNDFSIQQITKAEDLRIAVECFERIVRFHIVSLHQLALPEKPYSKYDWQQEREQLDRTLLSLMQYYDDSRGRVRLENEAEFRAYCVIFQLQDPTPDLEDRVQTWPREIIQDIRVQKALDVYMAACNVMDAQGPLKPRANHLVARQDWQRFWTLVASKEVSYLMACVAEIYFNLVRRTVINAFFRTSRANPNLSTPEWTVDFLCDLLAFDDGDQVYAYCERFGFTFKEREDGQQYLDLSSVRGRTLPEPTTGISRQSKTELVEDKRFGRTLPAIINGLTVKTAQEAGLVTDVGNDDEGMEDVAEAENQSHGWMDGTQNGKSNSLDDGESLFIPESRQPENVQGQSSKAFTNGLHAATSQPPSMFSNTGSASSFGKPSGAGESSSVFAPTPNQPAQSTQSSAFGGFNSLKPQTNGTDMAATTRSPFDFTRKSASEAPGATNHNMAANKNFSSREETEAQSGVFSNGKAPSHSAPLFQFSASPPTKSTESEEGLPPPETHESPSTTAPKADTQASSPDQAKTQLSFGPSAAAPATSTPSQQPETKASQPHFTTSPASPSSPTSNTNTSPALNGGLKRPSFSGDWRPNKPSPLSNSITANEETNNAIESESIGQRTETHSARELFPVQQNQVSGTASTESKDFGKQATNDTTKDFDSIVTQVATEFYTDPVGGILKQYIEYHVRQTVRQVKDQIDAKDLAAEVEKFRRTHLLKNFGRKWRDIVSRRRLAKSGRERRQRRQRRLEERGSQEIETGSLLETESILGDSMDGSVSSLRDGAFNASREMVNSMYERFGKDRQGLGNAMNDQQQQAGSGSKRPTSSSGPGSFGRSRESGHKRLRSTSHVDDRGRVMKPSATSHPNSDILKRSAFLGFSLPRGASSNKNRTKTNYFRLKALGVHDVDEAAAPRGTKRRLSDSLQSSAQTSPPALRPPSLIGMSPERASVKSLMPPPYSAPSTQKTNDDDEALFARLKAARETLKDSTSYLKSEMGKGDEFQHSMNSSRSSNEFQSPSIASARVEARLRASQATSETGATSSQRGLPAYRMRESRFVPRDQYSTAIQRANEIRQSRSRDTSRPASRVGGEDTEHQPTSFTPAVQPESATPPTTTKLADNLPRKDGLNGFSPKQEQQMSSASAPTSNPFSSFTPRPPVSFANHTTQMSESNPFLHATISDSLGNNAPPTISNSFNNYEPQTTFGIKDNHGKATGPHDKTVQPSQINQALANSFGSSHGHGQNQYLTLPQDSLTPPQQDSYLQSQTISLLSDDEDEAPVTSANRSQVYSAQETDADEELMDETTDQEDLEDTRGHPNPYALLAHQAEDEEDEQGFDSQVEDGHRLDEDQDEGLNGYADDEDEDEESVNGEFDDDVSDDVDAEDSQGYDANGYKYDEEEDEDAEQHEHELADWEGQQYDDPWTGKPQGNPALQEVGNTAEDAIELLSD